jgi:hypothetical protein
MSQRRTVSRESISNPPIAKKNAQLSFKMVSILSIWSDFHVDDALETEVVRLILEKVIHIREETI